MRSSTPLRVTLTSTVSARMFWLSFREYVVSPCSCKVFSSARLIAPFLVQKWEAMVIASHVAEFEAPPAKASQPAPPQSQPQSHPARIPQVDGPSSSSSDSSSPPPQQYALHSSHPS